MLHAKGDDRHILHDDAHGMLQSLPARPQFEARARVLHRGVEDVIRVTTNVDATQPARRMASHFGRASWKVALIPSATGMWR